jgi:hypothetical protein
VRNKVSKKGRPRKVLHQGKACLTFTGKNVTSQAGMVLFARGMEKLGVGEQLQRITDDLDGGCEHRTSEILEQLIVLRLCAGEALTDTAALKDEAFRAMFSWEGLPHPTTIGRRLKALSYRHNVALQELVRQLADRVEKSGQKRLIAVDSTVLEAYGEQQGAEVGYNPKKPGRRSYHPLLAVDVGCRCVLDGYLRPGCAASNDGLDPFLNKIVAESPSSPSKIIFRLDKGLSAEHTFETIEALGCGYVAKVKKNGPLMRRIGQVTNWGPVGNGCFAADFDYKPESWSKPRRFVVIERHVQPKSSAQLNLLDFYDGRYELIVTNLSLRAQNIWRLYNAGAVVEQVIEELKNDLAASAIKTNHFWANDALFITCLIAYNLLNYLRRKALPRSFHTARLKRIGFLFLNLPANVVQHSRRLWLKINRDYPLRLIFYRAWDALGAA